MSGRITQPQATAHAAPMREVEGKVAFITGGDSGIGLGIARAFVSAGMKVAITYRSRPNLEEAMQTLKGAADRVHAIGVDVTDREAMVAAATETERAFGKIHVLVNNAGVAPLVPLSSATFDDWDWCMSTNVNGVFNGIRAFLPRIRAHGDGGQIVATSSMLGGLVVGPFWGVYSASKFAVVGMMEALRSELASTNIGVSVFCPAGVSSKLGASDRNRPAALAHTGMSDPNVARTVQEFVSALKAIAVNDPQSSMMMDPLEAGMCVLEGIRNNDLYILSHAEYAQAIRERHEALLASVPRNQTQASARLALVEIARTSIYAEEIRRRMTVPP